MQIIVQFDPQSAINDIATHDKFRQQITEAITDEFPNATVDLVFTLDKKWFGNIADLA